MLIFAAAPVLAILTAVKGVPAPIAPAWAWAILLVGLICLTVAGYRFFTRDRVLRHVAHEGMIELRPDRGGDPARCSEADFAVRLCPVRILLGTRPISHFWSGFALVADVSGQQMLIACDRSTEQLERQLREAPQWVQAAYSGEGPAMEGVGTVRVSELLHARRG
jgi:hypothetical protein